MRGHYSTQDKLNRYKGCWQDKQLFIFGPSQAKQDEWQFSQIWVKLFLKVLAGQSETQLKFNKYKAPIQDKH